MHPAQKVLLSSSDLPGIGRGIEMKKGDNSVWEATTGPVPSGAYRYNFSVDGLAVIDPRNPATSEANMNTWSLVYVPGSDAWDTKDVPHGGVARLPTRPKLSSVPDACTFTLRPATKRAMPAIPSSISFMARLIATRRGPPSVAPASSSTT